MYIDFGGPVAQWIEQRFPKPRVGRSIRLGATSFFLQAIPGIALLSAVCRLPGFEQCFIGAVWWLGFDSSCPALLVMLL